MINLKETCIQFLKNKGLEHALKTYQKGEIISIAVLKSQEIKTKAREYTQRE